jgi:hypothetical protein
MIASTEIREFMPFVPDTSNSPAHPSSPRAMAYRLRPVVKISAGFCPFAVTGGIENRLHT